MKKLSLLLAAFAIASLGISCNSKKDDVKEKVRIDYLDKLK